ncbi:hypothetical protein [Rhodoferax sp.]|uniref:hypothetical protein n=1 Tax=Rhodoferax sp. TaxID=50421 RepID=UPI0027552ADF|nr:hypothetical protein [Rhodoferax sp.]
MNTTLMTTPALMAPLQSLLRWLLPAATQPQAQQAASGRHRASGSTKAPSPRPTWVAGRAAMEPGGAAPRRPLRVVRFLEAGQTPAQVGRMVISGRMADVCAELDRLAAREAALH